MSTATTPTNTPYSSSNTSSSPTAPHNYVPTPSPTTTVASSDESGFSPKEVFIYGGGLVLTAVITYFSTLISVNTDISNNRENILVLKTDVSHLQGDLKGAENDIAKNDSVSTSVRIIEVKVSGLQKQIDAHIGAVNQNEGITK